MLPLVVWLGLAALAPAQDAPPDNVVLKSGGRYAGTVTHLNDRQIILQTPEWGRVYIPRDRVVGLYIATEASRISTEFVPIPDSILLAGAAAAAGAAPGGRDAGRIDIPPIPRGARLFSVMPGEGGRGPFALTGPLNPLDGRLWVAPRAGPNNTTALPPAAIQRVRFGFDAVIVEETGASKVYRGATWEEVAVGGQLRRGDRLSVESGRLVLKLRNDTLLALHAGTRMELVRAPEEGTTLAVRLEEGMLWLENTAAAVVGEVATPHLRIASQSRGFSVSVDLATGSAAANFDGAIQVTNLVAPSPPAVLQPYQRMRVDAAGTDLGVETLAQEDLQKYRGGS